MNTKALPGIEIECLDGAVTEKARGDVRRERLLPVPVSVAAVILITVSVVIHAAFIVSATAFLDGGRAEELLLSLVMPGFETIEKSDAELSEESEKVEAPAVSASPYVLSDSDLSAAAENGLALQNETSYSPSLAALLQSGGSPAASAVSVGSGSAPLVLILHTHGTECYSGGSDDASFRCFDTEKNVVAVGTQICDVLEGYGIGVIHLTDMFDADGFSTAYDRSAVAVRDTLIKYPSIQYIFDVHRDCIQRVDGSFVRSVSTQSGYDCAQLMLVCGTDEGGADHSGWEKNLALAARLQECVYSFAPGIMRPINLKAASFYQSLSPGFLILEAGCCGNTLTEAKRAAAIFACRFAGMIKGTTFSDIPTILSQIGD